MKRNVAKVLGPYKEGKKWRLVVKDGKARKSLWYAAEEEALAIRSSLVTALESQVGQSSRTIGETIDEYLTHKQKRGCNERTLRTVRDRLVRMLPTEQLLSTINPERAESLYAAETERFAVATHHKSLREAKAFFYYCVKQKYVAANPFLEVQSVGKANAGKPQLRTDEARKLSDYLLGAAQAGDSRALALIVQVLLGLRSGEVLGLRKRDLDCDGSVVVIEGTKSKNAKRSLELDAPAIRDLLLRRCAGLAADGFIFAREGTSTPPSTTYLWKGLGVYCGKAGVPVVCPHSLRGLHSTLAVKAGATSTYVAQALGHGSDEVTKRHYIERSALDAVRAARVAGVLLGKADLSSLITALRTLPKEELDTVCSALGYRR